MVNVKRDRNGYRKRLGQYRLNRADIIAIEKLLRLYADAHEINYASKYGKRTTPPDGRKHMPRVFADMNIKIGRYEPYAIELGWNYFGWRRAGIDFFFDADSVKFLPKSIKKARYFELQCRPGITLTFTPLSTTIYAQTHYATGRELTIMKEAVLAIETFLLGAEKSRINICTLDG